MPVNILNLAAYIVTDVHETEHDYHIYAETRAAPDICPHCISDNLVGFGRREQLVKDLPIHGKRVGVYINTRRLHCRSCSRTFYQALPDIAANRQMTSRLVNWIGSQALKRPFLSIADETGVDEKSIRNIFRDYINDLEKTVRFEVPRHMGIDEIHVIRPRCIVSNIDSRTAVEILPDRNKKSVINYLSRFKGRDLVKLVAMDMWQPYRDAVSVTLPRAVVVIDKFHVLRMANDCLERIRKELKESLTTKQRRGLMHDRFILLKRESELVGLERITLESWTRNFPALGDAYRAKEEFYSIYDSPTRGEAVTSYHRWQTNLTSKVAGAFQPLTGALENWQTEIFNYFDHPITNAYTESLNNLIRVINRLGRGYSFDALRAKILFTEGIQKKHRQRPKFQRRAEPAGKTFSKMLYHYGIFSSQEEGVEINYGADISTLTQWIEEGKL